MPTESQSAELRIVAFGASAGGLQALRQVVSQLRPNGRCTYVVAQHLAAQHPSKLDQLLGLHCLLPVTMVEHHAPLLPDHIMICPPGQDIEVSGQCVILVPRAETIHPSPSIDRLFGSLALSAGNLAVGVVLSGSGADGMVGAIAINRAAGVVIAQTPDQAIHPSMPLAVIQAGYANLIGNSDQIAAWLNEFHLLDPALLTASQADPAEPYGELFRWVSAATGLDLSRYKESTLRRQTIRRYNNLGFSSLAEYLDALRNDPVELRTLQESYLISVSSFFRDSHAFAALEASLRRKLAGKADGESFRVWVPGCATGEEAYSIGILLAEILGQRLQTLDVRIFASDVDAGAVEQARAGWYPLDVLATLPAHRQQWFTAKESGTQIAKEIRELCVFSVHDVVAHPPFIRMDLISCRNLLIYLKAEQQSDLINTFHYALNPDGLLLLGNSESVGNESALFETVDGHRLYRRLAGSARHTLRFGRIGNPTGGRRPQPPKAMVNPARKSLVDSALSALAKYYGPAAVLVDSQFEPIHFFGHAQRFFALTEDSADFSVFALCLPQFRHELRALCFRLTQDGLTVLEGAPQEATINNQPLLIRLALRRIELPEAATFAVLICFTESTPSPVGDVPLPGGSDSNEMIRLRKELAETREHLQAVIEELESANEELESLNAEVQSSGEELQASNEELQASNEELTTLNDELRTKSIEADELSGTLSNIQNSMSSSLVVVDREGRITRYNPLATRIFGLVAHDVGQFLYGVPCHLHLPQLRQQVNSVVANGVAVVDQVHQGAFHYLMQIAPFRNEHGEQIGAILNFADISDLHRAEQAKESSEIRFRQIWESTLEGLLVVDDGGHIVMANPALQHMFGYAEAELLGHTVELLVPVKQRHDHIGERDAFQSNPKARQMARTRDVAGRRKDGGEFYIEVSLSSMPVGDNRYVLASVTDITLRKQALLAFSESEQRLRLALDSAQAGTWEWYPAQKRCHWSDETWKLLALDPDTGLTPSIEAWIDRVHVDDRALVTRAWNDAVDQQREFEIVWRRHTTDGGCPPWLLSRGRPRFDPQGNLTHFIGIVLDITQRKRAEAELESYSQQLEQQVEERTAQLAEFYNSSPCGYHSLDRDGYFVSVNDTEIAWLGYSRDELVRKKTAIDIMAPHSHAVFHDNYAKFQATGVIANLELDWLRKDGSTLPISLSARAVYDGEGRFSHSLSTIIDNSDRKKAEQAWIAAREAAESANRAKTAFLANMSHEIRTPLSAIIGLGNIMRRSDLDDAQTNKLVKIEQSARHLLAIVNDILDLSKIEAEKLELHDIDFDLNSAIHTVVSMAQDRMAEKNISLVIEIDPGGGRLCGDATRFTQALLNLVTNAVKFTDRGIVTIRAHQQDVVDNKVLIRVEVEDSGIGIPPEVLHRLFVPFEQGDMSTTRKYGGTGLGLTITKRLAELMGGEAGASSTPGKGSIFWFTVWLKSVIAPTLSVDRQLSVAAAQTILKRDFAGCQVLVVEDEPINREVICLYLEELGMRVTEADNGSDGVNLAKTQLFSIVLMDMQMPIMDGITATRIMRELPGWSQVPIIAITANAFVEDRAACLGAGMTDFIIKPVDPDQFYVTLLNYLQRAGN